MMSAATITNAWARLLAPPPPAPITEEQRQAVLVLRRAGHTAHEIARRLKLPRDLVAQIIRDHPRPPPPPRRGLGPAGWELYP